MFRIRLQLGITALMLVALLLGACASSTTETQTPTPRPSDKVVAERLTAEIYGRLVSVDNCLRLNTDDGTSYLLVWPQGFVVDREGDVVKVADAATNEKAIWHMGDVVWLGGGEMSILSDQERQNVPANCLGPYWLAGGLEMPATLHNLVLFLGFRGIDAELTGDLTKHGFAITGESILANGERISVYEFTSSEVAKTEAALVSSDGSTITRRQGEKTIVTNLNWVDPPRFYHRDRVIAIYGGEDPRITNALESLLGPPFASGNLSDEPSYTDPAILQTDPDLVGLIKEIKHIEREKVQGTILVEGTDRVQSSDRYVVKVTNETITLEQGGGTIKHVAFDIFKVGQQAKVWFAGPVRESYPAQVDASQIQVVRMCSGLSRSPRKEWPSTSDEGRPMS